MALKDILIGLTSYPEPTGRGAIEQGVAFAALFGAHLTALIGETEIPPPIGSYPVAGSDLDAMLDAEQDRSGANARALLATVEALASRHGVALEPVLERAPTSRIAAVLCGLARMRDLTVIAVPDDDSAPPRLAEELVFDSGRPVMLVPDRPGRDGGFSIDAVAVAWDGSRTAMRAVADARPILERAKRVHVVTFTDDKPIPADRSGAGLARHLARHGIDIVLEECRAGDKDIGAAIAAHVEARRADLLVMGAYGHSRLREFVLGGATRSILARPPVPTVMSH